MVRSEGFQQSGGLPPSSTATITLLLPPRQIALFKAIIESYDNLATLRTDDPETHRLKLFFTPEMAEEVELLLESLRPAFEIRRV
jgi:Domain of unknown function (DUF4911)